MDLERLEKAACVPPNDSALDKYFERFGPTCDHHPDECPDDCERLGYRAGEEAAAMRQLIPALLTELRALRAEVKFLRENNEALEDCLEGRTVPWAVLRAEMLARVQASLNPAVGS